MVITYRMRTTFRCPSTHSRHKAPGVKSTPHTHLTGQKWDTRTDVFRTGTTDSRSSRAAQTRSRSSERRRRIDHYSIGDRGARQGSLRWLAGDGIQDIDTASSKSTANGKVDRLFSDCAEALGELTSFSSPIRSELRFLNFRTGFCGGAAMRWARQCRRGVACERRYYSFGTLSVYMTKFDHSAGMGCVSRCSEMAHRMLPKTNGWQLL